MTRSEKAREKRLRAMIARQPEFKWNRRAEKIRKNLDLYLRAERYLRRYQPGNVWTEILGRAA